jgi:fermentation-respiration switch protein FrsA (DUF1100 family)
MLRQLFAFGGRSMRRALLVLLLLLAAAPARALPPSWYAPPPGAPYVADEMRVRSHETHSLGGTITLPTPSLLTGGRRLRFPAVVLVTGAGKQNRDHTAVEDFDRAVQGRPVYRPYYELADTLSRHGIAVLRLDDRGVGASTGSQDSATTFDRSFDIRDAIELLRKRPDIDPRRIGVIGLSEGALIATMIASSDSALRGIVLMASPSANGRETVRWQREHGVSGDSALAVGQADSALKTQMSEWDRKAETDPWLHFFATYDPLPTARRVLAPVLILQGDADEVVPPEGAQRLAQAFRAGGNRDVSVRVLSGLTHTMLRAADFTHGEPDASAYHLPAELKGDVVEWVTSRFGGPTVSQAPPPSKQVYRRRVRYRRHR